MHQSSRAWWLSLGTVLIVSSMFVVATPVSSVSSESTSGTSLDGPAPLIHCRFPFLCEPPIGWGSPVRLDPDFHYLENPVVAVDSGGNAMALWSQIDGVRWKVWASRYVVDWGWSIPSSLDERNSDGGLGAQVAMDADGNAFAVWSQFEGSQARIMANRFTPAGEWDTATSIQSNDSAFGHSPQIAVDSGGNATAVWVQSDDTHFPAWSSRYRVGSGWDPAVLIMPSEADASSPQVVMDPDGNAIAVWMQLNETRYNIWANRYAVGSGWGVARQLQVGSEDAYNPRVAVDKSGNAFAVWYERDGDKSSVWANRFEVGAGWRTAQVIETSFSDASGPGIAVDSGGNAIAVWTQQNGGPGTQRSIWSNRYTLGSGWGSAMPVERSENDVGLPRVVVDESGNGIAAWTEWADGRGSIAVARQPVSGDWAPSVAISGGEQADATFASMAIDASGNALVVWKHFEGPPGSQGLHSVGTNRYTTSRGWGTTPTLLLGRHLHGAHSPDVAMNARGDTVVAWVSQDDQQTRVVAGAFTNPVLGFPTEVVSSATVDAGNVRLALDETGNAFAVWTQTEGNRYSVWSNRYALGSGWGTAMLIDSMEPINPGSPLVASDPEGNAIVVWTKWAGQGNQLWATRYAARSGWGPSTMLSSGGGHINEGTPRLTVDDAGNMIVAWVQWDDIGAIQVYANRYAIGNGWGTTSPISGQIGASYGSLSIDSNGDGTAVVAWDQFVDPGRFEVWGNRYGIATGWEGATLIADQGSRQPSGLRVSVDGLGNAFVVGGSVGLSDLGTSLFASRYTVESGWSQSMPIRTLGQRSWLAASDIEIDADGDLLVTWSESDGVRTGLWATRYVTDWGWTTPTRVSSRGEIDAWGANLAAAESGNSTVVWSEWDGTRSRVWMNTYVPDSTPLALSLTIPTDGAVVETPVLEVTGSTKPGALVFINDLPAAVGVDGSFSATVALHPGRNVVTARAIDLSWNTARVSTVVTYSTLPSSLLVLLFTQAALAASTFILFVLYRKARHPPPGTRSLIGTPERSDPAKTEPIETAPRSQHKARAPWNGWASAIAPLRLTAKERILLHLLSYTKFAEAAEVPPDIAQAGIASIAGVDSRHFAQYIRPLVRAGLVRERTAHVKGNLHRRRVYSLTEMGRKTAIGIRDRLRPVVVQVRDSSGTREVTIGEVLAGATGSLSILDIVRQALQDTSTRRVREESARLERRA